jgi:benzoyl-CoA reductase subunit C
MLALSVASASVPKDRFNPLVEQYLEELERRDPVSAKGGPRLLVMGGTLDEPGYLELIESMGASIVADQLCWGTKSFSHLTDEEIDPIDAIARRMLEHMPCPRMLDQYPKRLANLLEALKRYRVDGVICERLKFCDLWGGEIEMLRRSLKQEAGIPLLVLERDYAAGSGVGQLRTRVQAFLETLA